MHGDVTLMAVLRKVSHFWLSPCSVVCWDGVNGHTPSLGLLRAALALHAKCICALLLLKSVIEAGFGEPGLRVSWHRQCSV